MISSFPDGQESGGCKFQDAFFEVDLPDDDLDDLELEVELDIGPSIPGINAWVEWQAGGAPKRIYDDHEISKVNTSYLMLFDAICEPT